MPGLHMPLQRQSTIVRFEEMTANAAQVQEMLLNSILEENASCEYLQNFGLPNGRIDPLTFQRCVPMVTHADLKPYIQRIVDGEKSSILTSSPIDAISLSSGTTDTREKYLPYHEGLKAGTLEVASIAAAFRDRVYPITAGARILEFIFCGKFFTTKGGLRAGTATTHLIRSDAFKLRQIHNRVRPCSPEEVVFGSDCRQTMYCHLLCGLLYSEEVQVLSSTFAYTLVEALRTLENEWQNLCEDIRVGRLSPKITDNTLRAAVGDILIKPNPKLAEVISSKCRGLMAGDWNGVTEVLWPRCKYVLSIMTGAMEPYTERLQHYAGKKVPLVNADYGATEGWIGVNVNPRSRSGSVSFTVVPSLAFFEFIPLHRSTYKRKAAVHFDAVVSGGPPPASSATAAYVEGSPVGLTQVKVGQEYEIVMTTQWGLYRYRLGDVVRVTGFYNACPQFAYVCRKNVVLSINIDKNTEKDLKAVVNRAARRLAEASGKAMELVDYTSYADQKTTPGHYVIFWEVGGSQSKSSGEAHAAQQQQEDTVEENQLQQWLAECATLMDGAFVEPGYVTSRKMNTIGALELCVVRRGTFARLLDRFLSNGATITQYKTPRCIVSTDVLSILRNSTSATLFSSATFP